jgi:hypothetical protein
MCYGVPESRVPIIIRCPTVSTSCGWNGDGEPNDLAGVYVMQRHGQAG